MLNPLACMTSGYHGHGLERVFEGIARAGFRYVELVAGPALAPRIDADNLTKASLESLRRMLANFGLFPISVAGHTNLVAPDGPALFRCRLELAAAVGARIVNTGCGHTESKEEERRFFSIMPDLARYAERLGIVIALETHGGLTGTGPDARMTLERIGSPFVKVNYDTANVIYYRGVRPEEDLPHIVDQVAHVHLKDKLGGQGEYNFPALGEGSIDFHQIVSALADVGYLGPFSVEIEVEGERTAEEEDALRARLYQYASALLDLA